MFRKLLHTLLGPAFRRPPRFQIAAMCYRYAPDGGALEVLLITSRDTGRWVVPKGWPKAGLDAAGAAMEEAWEEAGVTPPDVPPTEIGAYHYDKRLDGGLPVDTKVHVYATEVTKLEDNFPEAGQRERRWVSPEEAAGMVQEPELSALFRRLPAILKALEKFR
ncbi:NUDIX hydrolase [Alloyangia pacifica]|uniref:NUDIX hydrolase n=1 Tax=Alloyangia pacifica TaxID=311180 RepID=UPI001CD412E2|nr:NUDIX hydrolase [Alloyangia pacifica]MCA0998690.1 NUDIX hydrolase [Alloyangia pacifica]